MTMIRVTTPSRLHFGLFRLPADEGDFRPDLGDKLTLPARSFGGVGLMIDKPGVQVSVAPAKAWSATGPLAERALAFAQTFLGSSPELAPHPFAITVEHCAPEHAGLGTGTQLGLAVSRALAAALGRPDWPSALLAGCVGRGQRSGVGVHGFQQGGFLVDGGKNATTILAPLVARHDFPADWAILLILPNDIQGVHGAREREAFAHLAKSESAQETDLLCRLVLLGMLPALVEHDLPAFGEALYEFNRRVGETFMPWQGGIYASPKTAAIVDFMRTNGVRGAGQSSWGPALFGIAAEGEKRLAGLLRQQFALSQDEVLICPVANRGAQLGA
jgi:beta-RFAP synthase